MGSVGIQGSCCRLFCGLSAGWVERCPPDCPIQTHARSRGAVIGGGCKRGLMSLGLGRVLALAVCARKKSTRRFLRGNERARSDGGWAANLDVPVTANDCRPASVISPVGLRDRSGRVLVVQYGRTYRDRWRATYRFCWRRSASCFRGLVCGALVISRAFGGEGRSGVWYQANWTMGDLGLRIRPYVSAHPSRICCAAAMIDLPPR